MTCDHYATLKSFSLCRAFIRIQQKCLCQYAGWRTIFPKFPITKRGKWQKYPHKGKYFTEVTGDLSWFGTLWLPGPHSTKDFSFTIQIIWKYYIDSMQTLMEMDRLSGWLLWLSLGTLKASFNVLVTTRAVTLTTLPFLCWSLRNNRYYIHGGVSKQISLHSDC